MSRNADLVLIDVTKKYGDTIAVDDISLKILSGTYCCLLGPSGCGKTTTLRMVAGHEAVTSGDVLLGLENVTDKRPAARGTAMMFQNYALFPHLKVRDNVAFSLKMRGTDRSARDARADEMLKLVDMERYADRLPAQLSGGRSSASPSPGPWSPTPRSSCSTSRCRRSIHSCGFGFAPSSSASSATSEFLSSTSPTVRKRQWRWPT